MPQAWRIVKRRHASEAFNGEGARIYGGRWNSPGRSAVYVSETRALATLEMLAGIESTRAIGAYVLIGVSFDESLVAILKPGDLEDGWDANPPTHLSQAVGDRWLDEADSVVLRVPSVVVPAESNYVLNPTHPDFSKIQIGSQQELHIDPRLLSE